MCKNSLILIGSICLALTLAVTSVVWCGAGEAPATVTKTIPKMKMTIATYLPEKNSTSRILKYFGDLVTEKTNGQVTFRYFFGGSLGGAKEIVPLVSSGAADIGYVSVGYYPADFKLLTLSGMVLVAEHMDTLQKAVSQLSEENRALSEEFAKLNLQPLLTIPSDVTTLGSNKKIETVGDLQGLRVRTYGMLTPLLKAWKAIPVALPSPDIYGSMERGILDGYTAQTIGSIGAFGLQEVTDHIIDLGIGLYFTGFAPMNKDKYASLSGELKKIFEEAAIEVSKKSATIYHDEGTRKFLPNILKKAKIYRLSPEVRKELKAIGLPAVKQAWIDQVVKGGVSESDAHALLYRYIELCTKYDAESKTKTGFDVWETEFK